ncbi:MAG: metal-sensing transcriptional repressor [Pseudomonadota bacterium]|nr:metal-sensing transcriptional repressor [Pseudomonadota bacterium]
MKHASHPDIIAKLKQAQGQIGSIVAMMAEGRSCMELAQQLQAAESIVHLAKRALIQDHMEHCITDAASQGGKTAREAMAEFKTLSKYL